CRDFSALPATSSACPRRRSSFWRRGSWPLREWRRCCVRFRRPSCGGRAMSPSLVGLLGILALIALILLRMPVALALFAVGFAGVAGLSAIAAAKSLLASEAFAIASRFDLIVIPLFILMGNLGAAGG